MASRPPSQPLIVVLGSTGTGKSQLAVELATRFNGEIINADSMQMYRGLPILTNKMSHAEQRGIPHHLLGHVAYDDTPWDVIDFERKATRIVAEIRSRGNLPILVGGTHYYLGSMLFTDIFFPETREAALDPLPELDQPTDVLWQQLKDCDPVMANRWHPNDRRKIRRSLEIFLRTGRPASEYYAEQQQRKTMDKTDPDDWQNLLFWIHCDRDVLQRRVEARVDDMVNNGMLDEVRQLYQFKQNEISQGRPVDMSKGVWQSIGYRQLEPYIAALCASESPSDQPPQQTASSPSPAPQPEDKELAQLKSQGIMNTKFATRRYAVSQVRWIRLKQIPRLADVGPAAMDSLYVLDSTNVTRFASDVVEPAVNVTGRFLAGEPLPHPSDISDRAKEVLAAAAAQPPSQTSCRRTCELCGTVCLTEKLWAMHINGTNHRRKAWMLKKVSLVPFETPALDIVRAESPSSIEIASLFS
ncbi:hypothetical protein CDD82_2731 [Ophiocordyceps australis]|uniref:tRNA dimethylallyltransferase n=1 Tax=Ophiocordyceps australis TaxID=1399860 RepID=A0A2C5YLN1_9HYPO|nr:hypothetical protein CDD82_2731 [Ophiocordyceps australis]